MIYGSSYVEECSFDTHLVENLMSKVFCIYLDIHKIFILKFIDVVYHIDWFVGIQPFLNSLESFQERIPQGGSVSINGRITADSTTL